MPKKPKTNQPQTPNETQGRDFFQTPNYAVDLLVPFIPKNITWVWEPACGDGKIVQRLTENGLGVYPSDIRKSSGWVQNHVHNFISDSLSENIHFLENSWCVITNPPFSLKYKFIYRALEFDVPFAFLIPFDMCGQMYDLMFNKGLQAIVPDKRIDYITPKTLERIHEGELWKFSKKTWLGYKNLTEFKKAKSDIWQRHLENNQHFCNYTNIDEVPKKLLAKYSTSQFHSIWITHKFNLKDMFVPVELTKEMKENI